MTKIKHRIILKSIREIIHIRFISAYKKPSSPVTKPDNLSLTVKYLFHLKQLRSC